VKNLIVLLFVGLTGVSCFGVVAAQELLIAPREGEFGDNVPDLALPPMPEPAVDGDQQFEGDASDGVSSEEGSSEQYETTPYADSWESGEGEYIGQLEPYVSDDCQMFQCNEPVLESTGTWIRRGFWYAEVDAVLFNHKSARDPIPLAVQLTGFSVSPFQTPTGNVLRIDGTKPGIEAAPRLNLGRFLFRDHKNRDHVAEFTVYGGGEWTQQATLNINPHNDFSTDSLIIPAIADGGMTSFDGATKSSFRYDSRFNNFELNYRVKDRMDRDLMEMEPSGRWVRRARPSITRSFLAGIRFFDFNEGLDWTASGIDPNDVGANDHGAARVLVDNNLFGTQLGFSHMYETARWSGGVKTKGGMFFNIIDARNTFLRTLNRTDDEVFYDSTLEADELSFIGEAALLGKWHLRPNFSLRASLEVLFVSSVASAPKQLPGVFIPGGPPTISSNSDSTWLGGSIGFEGYW
jgi:hypothetical protein